MSTSICSCSAKDASIEHGREATRSGAEELRTATISVWDDIRPVPAKRIGHPAPFPVQLPERSIQLFTYAGDLVLDPFMGSGDCGRGYERRPAALHFELSRELLVTPLPFDRIPTRSSFGRKPAIHIENCRRSQGFPQTAID
jgi:hypothetical protein